MTFEQAWNVVCGERTATQVVAEFGLTSANVVEWLDKMEREAIRQAFDAEGASVAMFDHHAALLAELRRAIPLPAIMPWGPGGAEERTARRNLSTIRREVEALESAYRSLTAAGFAVLPSPTLEDAIDRLHRALSAAEEGA